MANLNTLKKSTARGKGDLPDRGTPKSKVIDNDNRVDTKRPKKPLQFMVDQPLFEEFSVKAAEMFGHKKGAKTQYFKYMYNKLN